MVSVAVASVMNRGLHVEARSARAADVSTVGGSGLIATGDDHTLVVRRDGSVWAFGYNGFGQLGHAEGSTPVARRVAGLSGIVAVAAGSGHSLALRSDGTVWAFGYNRYGELGRTTNNGTNNANPVPAMVAGLSGIVAIAAGYDHSLALDSDGVVWAFGNNRYDQLGTLSNFGASAANPVPAVVPVFGTGAGEGNRRRQRLQPGGADRWHSRVVRQQLLRSTGSGDEQPDRQPESSDAGGGVVGRDGRRGRLRLQLGARVRRHGPVVWPQQLR